MALTGELVVEMSQSACSVLTFLFIESSRLNKSKVSTCEGKHGTSRLNKEG